jgi:hypothetical protein
MRSHPTRPTRGPARAAWALMATAGLTLAWGCGSTKMSGTARTGKEQLLLSSAWDKALQRVDFRPLTGVPVYLDTTNVTSVDQGWVVSSLRQAMLSQGVLLRAKPEQAQWIVEARVGAYGTDEYNFLIGVPQVNVPATVPGVPAGTVPEIPLMKKSDQQAVAKLALFAYDRASGQIVWNSGTMMAKANAKDVYVGGLGPFQSGTIRDGTEFMNVKIPATGEAEPAAAKGAGRPGRSLPFSAPAMTVPPSASDLDSFAP